MWKRRDHKEKVEIKKVKQTRHQSFYWEVTVLASCPGTDRWEKPPLFIVCRAQLIPGIPSYQLGKIQMLPTKGHASDLQFSMCETNKGGFYCTKKHQHHLRTHIERLLLLHILSFVWHENSLNELEDERETCGEKNRLSEKRERDESETENRQKFSRGSRRHAG